MVPRNQNNHRRGKEWTKGKNINKCRKKVNKIYVQNTEQNKKNKILINWK